MNCHKCGNHLNDCPSCKGSGGGSGMFGSLTCSKCNNTGLVCSKHEGYWK